MDVKIIETATGRQVPAEIRPARSQDVVLWLDWHDQMPADAENGHWRWDQYILLAEMSPQELACFVLVAERALQGITLIEQEHENDLGEKDVHGLRISTAPWNRLPRKRFKYVGSLLVAQAVLVSLERGYEGRMWLESLPRAKGFYRGLGMIEIAERSAEGLTQFKFDPPGATAFLQRLRKGGSLP